MRTSTLAYIVPLTILLTPVVLSAQKPPADTTGVAAWWRKVLKQDLQNVITVQKALLNDNKKYATSVREMKAMGFETSTSVTVVLLTSSTTSHSEIAISSEVPGLVCATFVGDGPSPLRTGKEGEVVCRGP